MVASLISAFVTLLVTIGPIETAAVFAGLTARVHRPQRRGLAVRSTLIAGLVLAVFALAGDPVLRLLRVSLPAFQVAGGLLLLLQALTLTFSGPGLSSINQGEHDEAERQYDIAVFPLAFPVVAGPGSLSAVVLLMGRSQSLLESVIILGMLALCLALTYLAMRMADTLTRLLGETGADVVGRISGIFLAALAVQFVFDGLKTGLFA